jgi:hypothetical protein
VPSLRPSSTHGARRRRSGVLPRLIAA